VPGAAQTQLPELNLVGCFLARAGGHIAMMSSPNAIAAARAVPRL